MGASLRPMGAAFPKDKPALVREEATRGELRGVSLSSSLGLGPGERWFVARVLAHQENRAQFNLHRLGFRSFLPRLRRTIRHARKLRDTLNPLFPGYIFIVIDLSKQRWRSINGTFGVASLIMGAEQPMPVPPGVIEALVVSCESRGVVRLDDGLEIGQNVRILSGPFAETVCRLAHLDDRGRVRVLLEIMGMEVAAQLDRSAIAPAA
jgi:transcription antitermination factor NusG